VIVLGGVVVVSAIAALLLRHGPASYAYVFKGGDLTEVVNIAAAIDSYSIFVGSDGLNENDSFSEGFNVLEVERGRIRVSKADCPDGICIRQGWRSGGLMPIVCLPNRMVVTFEGGDAGDNIDAEVG